MITIEQLKEIKEKARQTTSKRRVHVCGGTGCTSSGSPALIAKLEEEIKKNGLENEVEIVKTGCFGLCA